MSAPGGSGPGCKNVSIRDFFQPRRPKSLQSSKSPSKSSSKSATPTRSRLQLAEATDLTADAVGLKGNEKEQEERKLTQTPTRTRTPMSAPRQDDGDDEPGADPPPRPATSNGLGIRMQLPILPSTPQRLKSTPTLFPPSPLPPHLSSPSFKAATPRRRGPLARDAVVADSDSDAGGDSDSSLEELSALLFKKTPAPAPAPSTRTENAGSCEAPLAKRLASSSAKGRAAARPGARGRLDIGALVKEAERADRIIEGFRKSAAALKTEGNDDDAMDVDVPPGAGDSILHEIAGEERIHRARKALERTGTTASRNSWYFFESRPPVPSLHQRAFPTEAAMGHWAILSSGATREQTVLMGLPSMMLSKGQALPDELFLWMLDAVCADDSAAVRREFANMLGQCPEQIGRLVTPEILDDMLCSLGAGKHLREHTVALAPAPEQPDRYAKHDFGRLISWLKLLAAIPPHMSPDALIHSLKALLRMGVDPIVVTNIDIHTAYCNAINSLCGVVKLGRWDDTCSELSGSLHAAFLRSSFRCAALLSLPSTSSRVHELRRRLAAAFFLGNPAIARQHPDDAVALATVLQRLQEGAEFRIAPETDYVELQALVLLLNLAVDDGPLSSAADDAGQTTFNADVDDIGCRLRTMWRSINDTGGAFSSRTDAKNALEWVQQRLAFTVRTRRPPKRDIYDLSVGQDDEALLSRQRAYMQKFLLDKPTVSVDVS